MNRTYPDGVAIVAGGSGGLGAAIARALAIDGSNVAITFRSNAARAQEVVSEIESLGRQASASAVDLLDTEGLAAFFRGTRERYGRIHTVVYAAGPVFNVDYISDILPGEWARTLGADTSSCFNLMREAIPAMRTDGGSLCAVTTSAVTRIPPADILSAAPKAAIEALMKAIAKEEGQFGIRANCVAPGCIDAGIGHRALYESDDRGFLDAALENTPMRTIGSADDVGQAVSFLCSSRAAFVTGQSLAVDGGLQL